MKLVRIAVDIEGNKRSSIVYQYRLKVLTVSDSIFIILTKAIHRFFKFLLKCMLAIAKIGILIVVLSIHPQNQTLFVNFFYQKFS